jgi:hypothetical protein
MRGLLARKLIRELVALFPRRMLDSGVEGGEKNGRARVCDGRWSPCERIPMS